MASRTLLVVDDSLLIRNVLTDAFVAAGWSVTTAGNGAEALRALAAFAPDLIVADVLMPEMDGWALCEAVRRDPATRGIPFIFLTSERDVPKRIKGLRLGADDFVCKPFSKEELLARADAVHRRALTGDFPAPIAAPPSGGEASGDVPLAGHTDHMPMSDLLQMLGTGDRSGTLHVRGASVGRIFLRGGRIINAETQGQLGEKALYRIIAWPSARFEFDPGVLPEGLEEALTGSTSSVLMEGFRQLDELQDLRAALPDAHRRLRAAAGKPSGALSTTHRLILRAASGPGCTLGAILDAVPDRDLEACSALMELLERGLIQPLEEEEAAGLRG